MDVVVRKAQAEDRPHLGRMAAKLVELHHALDPERFMLFGSRERTEEGYGGWLVRESTNADALVLVAEAKGQLVGYAYGTLEDRDWMALRDACAVLQDIWVEEASRRSGVAGRLIEAVAGHFRGRGAPRLVLSTAARNETAQRFFERMGFRRTMIEMTRELSETR